MTSLAVEQLEVWRGAVRAVDGVSFSAAAGVWFGVVGANGSGKTSLLRAIAGRLPLQGGTVRLEGDDWTDDREGRARAIGFAPDMVHLPNALTPRGALAIVAGNADAALGAIGGIGTALGLAPLLDRRILSLSAGQRQRVAVASAFARATSIVILDEPFNWLDPVAAHDLRGALAERVARGLTLVTALHDLPTLASACGAGILLAEGKVSAELNQGDLAAAFGDPAAFERGMIGRLRGGVVP